MGQGFVLMQDNDPKHTSKLCQKYIKSKKEQYVLQLISSAATLADLNLIELVWDELDRKVRAKQLISAATLLQFLRESRKEQPSVYFHSLVEKAFLIHQKF